jgi:septal ring factor EnvC (AmiA/AmiB activator)
MKKLLFIVMILTLSSCMVSQKAFDEKCCKMEAEISELKSRCNGMDLKEQLLREAIHDLQTKSDTIVVPHDPANE